MFIFLVTIVLYNLLNALAVSDIQEIKRDAKIIDCRQRITTMYESEKATFSCYSLMGHWLKKLISLFPKTIPDGCIILRPNKSLDVYIRPNEKINFNKWFRKSCQCLPKSLINPRCDCRRSDVEFCSEILEEIKNMLIRRAENKKKTEIQTLESSRNRKLLNDLIHMNATLENIWTKISTESRVQ